jgi:hypothetical protein
MIHYFNPGHETAVLHASKHYQPAARQMQMQKDLAYLPAWYAGPEDFVGIEQALTRDFQQDIQTFSRMAKPVLLSELPENKADLYHQNIDLWGISPDSIYRFEKLSELYQLRWQIPEWKEAYRLLGSRFTAHTVLSHLLRTIPDIEQEILPQFCSTTDEIEEYVVRKNEKCLVKSPYSSSGRGLVWLPPEKLAQSERQIISGMLKKQSRVSIEKSLDKQMDFSMHFAIDQDKVTRFAGYSIFQTNHKGVYQKSRLSSQDVLEQAIHALIDPVLVSRVKNELIDNLQKHYAPHYTGTIGVDMLIYRSGNAYRLHPCVEINMRKSMGYLAICLQNNYLHPLSKGSFQIDYHSTPGALVEVHKELKQKYPVVIENNRMVSGYMSLCPVTETGCYHAYLIS